MCRDAGGSREPSGAPSLPRPHQPRGGRDASSRIVNAARARKRKARGGTPGLLEPPGFFESSRYVAMAQENGPHRARIAQHATEWAARRARLIAGESRDATNAAEAA